MLNFCRLLLVLLLISQGATAMVKQSQSTGQYAEPVKKVKNTNTEKITTTRNLPSTLDISRHHKHITTYKINTVDKLKKDEEWDSEDECDKDCPIKKVKPGEKVWQENRDCAQQAQVGNWQKTKKTNKLETDVAIKNCSRETRSHQNECIETIIKDDGYEVTEEWDSYGEEVHEDTCQKKTK